MTDTAYGNATFLEKLGAVGSSLFHMPVVVGWALLTSPFHNNNRHKSWKRVVGDKWFYHVALRMNAKQLQWFLGSTRTVYEGWAKGHKLPIVIDELGENARLLWVGERRTDKVILYMHGGAFIFPVQNFAADFWKYVKEELKSKHDQDVGLAVLNYSLVPTATFPTQLTQAVLAVQHLISTGVDPKNIQITGDSAGGNLILQLISHMLHPVANVPTLTLSSPFRGIYLMSPWVSLTSETGSMVTNDTNDCIGTQALIYWGRLVLDGVPESGRPFLEAVKAPEGWFDQIGTVADRVLITAGDAECLRDVIETFANNLCASYDKAQFVMQKYGLHDDPHLDFIIPGTKKSELTPVIMEWLAAGFE